MMRRLRTAILIVAGLALPVAMAGPAAPRRPGSAAAAPAAAT